MPSPPLSMAPSTRPIPRSTSLRFVPTPARKSLRSTSRMPPPPQAPTACPWVSRWGRTTRPLRVATLPRSWRPRSAGHTARRPTARPADRTDDDELDPDTDEIFDAEEMHKLATVLNAEQSAQPDAE